MVGSQPSSAQPGRLFAFGNANQGAIGDGTTTQRTSPVQIGTDEDWISFSASPLGSNSAAHAAAVKSDGTLWTWGYNEFGQLGHGDTTNRSAPVQVGSATDWASVVCGGHFTLARKQNGDLHSCGLNTSGCLGLGDTTNRDTFQDVGFACRSMAAGNQHCLAVTSDGELYSWGASTNGALGRAKLNFSGGGPVAITSSVTGQTSGASAAVLSVTLTSGSWAASTAAGYLIVENVVGTFSAGELASPSGATLSAITYVTSPQLSPTRVGSGANWEAVAVGPGYGSGLGHSLALTDAGDLYSFGRNDLGQLGVGDTTNRFSLTQVAGTWVSVSAGSPGFSLAIKDDGTLWAWGDRSDGCLGDGSTSGAATSPQQVGSATNWLSVSCGSDVFGSGVGGHLIAVNSAGELWGWGFQRYGRLGNGADLNSANSSPTQIGSDTNWISASAGYRFTLALKQPA